MHNNLRLRKLPTQLKITKTTQWLESRLRQRKYSLLLHVRIVGVGLGSAWWTRKNLQGLFWVTAQCQLYDTKWGSAREKRCK